MRRVTVEATAWPFLTEIYGYTLDRWGEAQADRYVGELFGAFQAIASGQSRSRPAGPTIAADGFSTSHGRHVIYWRLRADGHVGVVAVLHERMAQEGRAAEAFASVAREATDGDQS